MTGHNSIPDTTPDTTPDTAAAGVPGGLRAVSAGEVVELVLPRNQTCRRLRLMDHLRTVRIGEQDVLILGADGAPYASPITHEEAGLVVDGSKMWAQPIPDTLWEVRRDGVRAASDLMASEDAGMRWIQDRHSYSADWGCQHEGYSIDQVTSTNTGTDREEPDVNTDPTTETDTDTGHAADETTSETTSEGAGEEVPDEKPKGTFFLAGYGGYPTGTRYRSRGPRG